MKLFETKLTASNVYPRVPRGKKRIHWYAKAKYSKSIFGLTFRSYEKVYGPFADRVQAHSTIRHLTNSNG